MDNNNLDDLEKELLNYKEMGTSINKIRTNETDFINRELRYNEREPFSDSKNKNTECDSTGCKTKKNNFSVDSFVKDLETNLDNFDNIKNTNGPLPSNINFKKEKMKVKNIEKFDESEYSEESKKSEEEPKKKKTSSSFLSKLKQRMYTILIEIKEPLIIIFLFILLNNTDLIKAITKIPYLNKISNNYPSLIIRGLILALLIYLLRKYE